MVGHCDCIARRWAGIFNRKQAGIACWRYPGGVDTRLYEQVERSRPGRVFQVHLLIPTSANTAAQCAQAAQLGPRFYTGAPPADGLKSG